MMESEERVYGYKMYRKSQPLSEKKDHGWVRKKTPKTGDFSSRTRHGMEKQMLGMVVIRNWRMSTSEARK
jgi:hypothetical protein